MPRKSLIALKGPVGVHASEAPFAGELRGADLAGVDSGVEVGCEVGRRRADRQCKEHLGKNTDTKLRYIGFAVALLRT